MGPFSFGTLTVEGVLLQRLESRVPSAARDPVFLLPQEYRKGPDRNSTEWPWGTKPAPKPPRAGKRATEAAAGNRARGSKENPCLM